MKLVKVVTVGALLSVAALLPLAGVGTVEAIPPRIPTNYLFGVCASDDNPLASNPVFRVNVGERVKFIANIEGIESTSDFSRSKLRSRIIRDVDKEVRGFVLKNRFGWIAEGPFGKSEVETVFNEQGRIPVYIHDGFYRTHLGNVCSDKMYDHPTKFKMEMTNDADKAVVYRQDGTKKYQFVRVDNDTYMYTKFKRDGSVRFEKEYIRMDKSLMM